MNAKVVSTDVAGNLASAKKNAKELSTIFDEYVFVLSENGGPTITIGYDPEVVKDDQVLACFIAGQEY